MPERHDGGYRLLFSHPGMVEDLLRGFLHSEGSAPDLLERRSEVYVSDRLVRREQDLVWRVRGAGGESLLYLLLEFQSEPDPQMALRISVYEGLLRQDLARTREVSPAADPPSIVAVVVYNGRERWTERSASGGSYRLIDVQRDPLPADPDNLVALLFQLERSRTPEALNRPVERLARLLAGGEMADLRRAFNSFLRESLLPGRFPEARIPAMLDLEEVRPMLRETVLEWTREWTREGEIAMLVRQLERKFGPLGNEGRARIAAADAEQLLDWGERLLTAQSLDEVFSG